MEGSSCQLDYTPEIFETKGGDATLLGENISSDSNYSTASGPEDVEKQQRQRLHSRTNYCAPSDPYAELINSAVEVRRRVHRANKATATLRDISRGMARRIREQEKVKEQQQGSEKMLREQLYLEFEEEFNSALETFRAMRFFRVLSDVERMSMTVTRVAFIASRRNLIRIQENQQTHLTRLLSAAWRQQYQLRQDIIRWERGMLSSHDYDGPSMGEVNHEEETSRPAFVFPLTKSAGGFDAGSETDDCQERDYMAPLYVLHKTLQRIGAMQKERLRCLVEETAATSLEARENPPEVAVIGVEKMSLLQMDVTIQLLETHNDVETPPVCEEFHSVEFVLHNSKNSMTWPQSTASVTAGTEDTNHNSSINDDVVFGAPLTVVERAIGPSLFFYAPLGGRISKECRALVRHGLVRMFTRQLCMLLPHCKGDQSTQTPFDTSRETNDKVDSIGASAFLSVERCINGGKADMVKVHWTPQMLQFLLTRVPPDMLCFTACLPESLTLIPFVNDLRSLCKSEKAPSSLHSSQAGKTCRLLFTFRRMEMVRQSLHDERTADRLASVLFNSYLKTADAMREAGGESLQPPLLQFCDALDCYQRALSLAQRGLLYPYSHALRPPPSLEDRMRGNAGDDDMDDEYTPVSEEDGVAKVHDITPANRHLNILLRLGKGGNNSIEEREVNTLYEDPLLVTGRDVFPHAHVLMHVWYSLHRQVVIAAANAAQTLLMMIPTTNIGVNESRKSVYVGKELQQRQIRAVRWCGRVLPLLQRLRKWGSESHGDPSACRTEWLWLHSMQFKVLLRRAKLLRVMGSLEEGQRSLEEVEQELHLQSSPLYVPSCFQSCNEVWGALLQDVRAQLTMEKTALRDEWKQRGGLVLRF